MKTMALKVLTAVALRFAWSSAALSDTPERQMNVKQGPDTVFDQPVAHDFLI